MKIAFFIVLLANTIFFFWEIRNPSSSANGNVHNLADTITLISELPESTKAAETKLQLADATEHPALRSDYAHSTTTELNGLVTIHPTAVNNETPELKRLKPHLNEQALPLSEHSQIATAITNRPDTAPLSDAYNVSIPRNAVISEVQPHKTDFGSKPSDIAQRKNQYRHDNSIKASSSSALLHQENTAALNQARNTFNINEEPAKNTKLGKAKTMPSDTARTPQLTAKVDELKPGQISSPKNAKAPFNKNCFVIGPFKDQAQINAWLADDQLNDTTQSSIFSRDTSIISYWVFYPAAETMTQSENNLKMLKRQGLTDLWLFRKGPQKGAISLGVFINQSYALRVVDSLALKGITAQIGQQKKIEPRLYVRLQATRPIHAVQTPLTLERCTEANE